MGANYERQVNMLLEKHEPRALGLTARAGIILDEKCFGAYAT